MGRFDGQVAIVTGGASGIGGATSRLLAAEGAKVIIADIADDRAEANVERITKAGGVARAVHTDVGVARDIERMVNAAAGGWGRLDILVQNAFPVATPGLPDNIYVPADEVREEAWDWGMARLAKALYLGAKSAAPHMKKLGRGSIVNISSVHGLLMAERYLVYETGKSAVIGMTKAMACDFGPHGIRVNAVCPGHIVTEGIAEQWKGHPGGQEMFADQAPLRKTGTPENIAEVIAFLCSEAASFITGHALVADGGLSIQLQEPLGVRQAVYARQHPDVRVPVEMV
jgi:NAD(P)-dependent dehydrogenase (short-subunit alcohol dehydrogenase family)